MEIKKVTVPDYRNLAKNNEYFLWSFLQREQNNGDLTLWSVFDDKINIKSKTENKLIDFLKVFPISFYESYVDESMDFLAGLGFDPKRIFVVPEDDNLRWTRKRKDFYQPVIVLFKKYQMVTSTFNYCYCVEGITEMILNEVPSLAENFKVD